MSDQKKINVQRTEVIEGEERFFVDINLFFGHFEIKRNFVKIVKIKKQVANIHYLSNDKIKSSFKIIDLETWPTSKKVMKEYFQIKLNNNINRINDEISWYNESYPNLQDLKEQIKALQFVSDNIDKIFSDDIEEYKSFNTEFKKFQGAVLEDNCWNWTKNKIGA